MAKSKAKKLRKTQKVEQLASHLGLVPYSQDYEMLASENALGEDIIDMLNERFEKAYTSEVNSITKLSDSKERTFDQGLAKVQSPTSNCSSIHEAFSSNMLAIDSTRRHDQSDKNIEYCTDIPSLINEGDITENTSASVRGVSDESAGIILSLCCSRCAAMVLVKFCDKRSVEVNGLSEPITADSLAMVNCGSCKAYTTYREEELYGSQQGFGRVDVAVKLLEDSRAHKLARLAAGRGVALLSSSGSIAYLDIGAVKTQLTTRDMVSSLNPDADLSSTSTKVLLPYMLGGFW